jgi:hypothetical protein
MLAELQDMWRIGLALLNEPIIRAGTTILAIASAAMGIWAARKARGVLHTHETQILVRQLQLMDDHWQRINYAVLTDDKSAATFGKLVGIDDLTVLRRHSFISILVDLLGSAYASRRRNIMPEEIYEAHFKAVAVFFHNRAELFFQSFDRGFYTKSFYEDCERRFKLLSPLSGTEMRDRLERYDKALSEIQKHIVGSPTLPDRG